MSSLFLAAALALLAGAALGAGPAEPAWRVLEATDAFVRLEVTIPAPAQQAAPEPGHPGAVRLVIPGGGESGAVGTPSLPTASCLVAIPAGVRVSGALIDYNATVLGDLDLAPVKASEDAVPARDAIAYAASGFSAPTFPSTATVLKDEAAKAALANGPAPAVAVGATAIMAGQPVVALTIAPVAYNAAARRAAVCERVVVELRFDAAGAKAAAARKPLPASFARLAGQQVLNLPRAKTLPAAGAEPGLWVAVVRSNATIQAKLQPLVDWRRRQGFTVEIVDADAVGNTTGGIKAALQAIYDDPNRPPLEYITLVGDATGTYGVPTWNESISGYGGEGDHYYALLEGDDILADAHIGRLSFSSTTTSQLDVIVNKILNYEKTPPMDNTAWFGRACVMGDESSSGVTTIWVNRWLKTQLLGLGWARVDTVWSGNFVTQMMASVNSGASVFGYRGYWGMSGIQSGNIAALANGGRLPVALLPTCDTGSFESDSECRSEAWLRATNGGGIAAVGTATIGTHTRYNNAYFLGAWDGLLYGPDHRVGAGHNAGKLGLYTNYFVGEPDKAEIWSVWNNLMGDPAVDMWIGVPQALNVTAPATLPVGANTMALTVLAGAAPAEGALVCALGANGARWRGQVDATGHVVLSGAAAVAGTMKLTVTGHGYLAHLANITVGASAAYCGATSVAVIDNGTLGSSGNGNGVANPGELLALVPTLTNSGTGAVSGVTALVSGGAPWLAITSGACTFGAINAGQAVAATGAPVLVTVAADAPDGQAVRLDVDATDGAQHWASALNLVVSAPRLAVGGVAFNGPGGSCDPGETGPLVVTLANGGSLASGALTATLTTTSPWLAVTDATGVFGAIASGGTGSNAGNTFAVYANSACFAGHLAPCTLTLSNGADVVAVLEFTVTVGSLVSSAPSGPDAYGYYAFDDTDLDSGRAPTYAWVELSPTLGGSGSDVGLGDFGWEQDATKLVTLPFTFRYYGKDQDQISICSNGWAAFGSCGLVSYHNAGIPGAGGTPRGMLAPFWDNLMQVGTNRVYHWYDAVGHRYIIQWQGLVQCYEGYSQDAQDFELILLDPAFHQTTSGEGLIIFQYKTVNNTDALNAYATVGIQSPDGQDGLLYSYWNHTMGGAATLASGRAILFTPLGDLVLPQIAVSPASLAASAAPGAQVVREVTVSNNGDAGSLLEVAVAKVDPATQNKAGAAGKSASKSAGAGDPVVTPSSIAGSTMTLDAVNYDAGSTVTLAVTVGAVTAGQEWILDLTLDAPPGVYVNWSTAMTGGTNDIPTTNATGDGATVFWDGSNGAFLDNGHTGHSFVNVTFSPMLQGDAVFTWTMQGDNYGTPPHSLNGTITLAASGPSIWVSAPAAGAVAVIGQPLAVNFVASNGPVQVAVDVQRSDGGAWETLTASTPAAGGLWTWPAVTGAPGPYARLRVRDVADGAVQGLSGVFAISRDLGWLQPAALAGPIPAGSSATLNVTLDATGLANGTYEALLVLAGNGGAPVNVPVTFTVGAATAVDEVELPTMVTLLGAVPNPFNPRTVIRFALPAAADTQLEIYSLDGRLVRRLLDGRLEAGAHEAPWDGRDDAGRDSASGVYFHRLRAGDQVRTGKMILAR